MGHGCHTCGCPNGCECPPSGLHIPGTHAVDCAKAHDHNKPCSCALSVNYAKPGAIVTDINEEPKTCEICGCEFKYRQLYTAHLDTTRQCPKLKEMAGTLAIKSPAGGLYCRAFMVPGRSSWDSYHQMPANALPCALPTGHDGPHLATQVNEAVVHPQHYGGDTIYEAIKVIEAWGLGFCLGNAVKYISRAGKKDPTKTIEDLKKARWYIDREIVNLEKTK